LKKWNYVLFENLKEHKKANNEQMKIWKTSQFENLKENKQWTSGLLKINVFETMMLCMSLNKWNFEKKMKFWKFEMLKFWKFELLKLWNLEILKSWLNKKQHICVCMFCFCVVVLCVLCCCFVRWMFVFCYLEILKLSFRV